MNTQEKTFSNIGLASGCSGFIEMVSVIDETKTAVKLIVEKSEENKGTYAWFPKSALQLEQRKPTHPVKAIVKPWFKSKMNWHQKRVMGVAGR